MDYYDSFIGKMLDNRYEILERIGTGGMAVVYKARCHRLNRLVAIKILKEDLAQDAEFRERFYAESQAVAMLSHTNIMGVYDVCHSDNIDYIVMELIEGITLKQYINRKGVLNWREALHFSSQIAKALSHAHSRGIIHRDIKPHNIMILKDGSVKVADFGIARLLNSQNTLTQNALGSVHYISPEQAKGGHIDARTDLYSLGVVMYEMMTNRLPFEGDSAVSIAIQHINSIPLLPSDINPEIPVGLEEIIMHAMEPDVDFRYASADEMIKDMEIFRQNPQTVFGYRTVPRTQPDPNTNKMQVPKVIKSPQKTEKRPARKPEVEKKRSVMPKITNSKETYGSTKRRAGRTSFLIGVFCSIVLILALFVLLWNTLLKDMFSPTEERITVPSFIGQDVYEVIGDEQYKGKFVFDVTYETNKIVPENQVINQSPSANRQMVASNSGITITLTVSSGAEGVSMPDVLNKDYRDAKNLLDGYGLSLNIKLESRNDENVTSGYVIEQTPKEGENLEEGMEITLIYSIGPEKKLVEVPGVVGDNEFTAKNKLESSGLSYTPKYIDDAATAGQVVSQDIAGGTQVELGTGITLYISNGVLAVPSEPSDEENPNETESSKDDETPPENEN